MRQNPGSKLNPNAPEFRPSGTVAVRPFFFLFSSFNPPPPPRSHQRPVVRGGYRPRMFSGSRQRREGDHGGSMMWRRTSRMEYSNSSRDDRQKSSSSLSNPSSMRSPPAAAAATGQETTLMLRNIPNQFTRTMLIQFLDDFCLKLNNNQRAGRDNEKEETAPVAYDFVYLPIDFRTKMNKGYAFVNFTTPKGVRRMKEETRKDQSWGYADSIRKRREIALAKIQGKKALTVHFEQSRFVCESDDYLPVCFSPPRDGSSSSSSSASGTSKQRNIGYRCYPT